MLVDGDVQSAGRVKDISYTGLFVAGPAGLHVGRRLSVVRMVDDVEGPSRPAEVVRRDGKDGAGVRFLQASEDRLLPDAAPNLFLAEAWDDEGGWLSPQPLAARADQVEPAVRFAVRADTIERLRKFITRDVEAGGTTLFTRELCAPGTRVDVVLVHPATDAELDLPAVVVRAIHEEPKRIEVAFVSADLQGRAELKRFLETGEPTPLLLPSPPDLELENARLRARIVDLEEALEESERTERSFLLKLQELERRNGR